MFDILYRVFYVLLSMELVALFLLPVILILRIFLQNLPKRYTVYLWRIYFFRILCPLSVSSLFCISSSWNRRFHQTLQSFGLTMQQDYGLLRSWKTVFDTPIETSLSYRICAFIWISGAIVLLFTLLFVQGIRQRTIQKEAVLLEGRIYQGKVPAPVLTGVFFPRYILSSHVDAKSLKYILPHMKIHNTQKSGLWRIALFTVTVLHWFNPLVWLAYYLYQIDEQMYCDDLVIRRWDTQEQMAYVQTLLNLWKEETVIPWSIGMVYETNIQNRARRLLYPVTHTVTKTIAGGLVLGLVLFWCFGLRPVQMAWNGGAWEHGAQKGIPETTEKPKEAFWISAQTVSPNGLARQIVLTGSEKNYRLEMYDNLGNLLDSKNIKNCFRKAGWEKTDFYFPQDMQLKIGDYNSNQANELFLGQIDKEKELRFGFLVFECKETQIEVVSDLVYVKTEQEQFSMAPDGIEGIKDIFTVQGEQGIEYYLWDTFSGKYLKKKMTQEEINQHKMVSKGSNPSGVVKTHELKDSNEVVKLSVSTQTDTTGSEQIRDIRFGDATTGKEVEAVQGYYCDLQWVFDNEQTQRYAVLTYNGTKSQTFVLYDCKVKSIVFRQEDGNTMLADLFRQYNDDSIQFLEGGVVIYHLQSKKNDILTIGYAADADGGMTIRGSFQYDLAHKSTANLQYEQVLQ